MFRGLYLFLFWKSVFLVHPNGHWEAWAHQSQLWGNEGVSGHSEASYFLSGQQQQYSPCFGCFSQPDEVSTCHPICDQHCLCHYMTTAKLDQCRGHLSTWVELLTFLSYIDSEVVEFPTIYRRRHVARIPTTWNEFLPCGKKTYHIVGILSMWWDFLPHGRISHHTP